MLKKGIKKFKNKLTISDMIMAVFGDKRKILITFLFIYLYFFIPYITEFAWLY